jgi:hypothetical protein
MPSVNQADRRSALFARAIRSMLNNLIKYNYFYGKEKYG